LDFRVAENLISRMRRIQSTCTSYFHSPHSTDPRIRALTEF